MAPQYEELPPRFYEELEAKVEETIRDTLYRLRDRRLTQPNNKVSRVLKQLLLEVPASMQAIASANLASALASADAEYVSEATSARLASRKALVTQLQVRLLLLSAVAPQQQQANLHTAHPAHAPSGNCRCKGIIAYPNYLPVL